MTTAMILWFGAADLALLGLLEWLEYLRRVRDRHMLERRLEDLVTFDERYNPHSGDFEECS